MNKKKKVLIILGSRNDSEYFEECKKILNQFDVEYEEKILSAHRNPVELSEFLASEQFNEYDVVITGAGYANHLSGTVAARTIKPVIGVPLPTSSLAGLDSLLSTVQMPKGVPVATMTIGKAGATNAGYFALRILASSDESLRTKLINYKFSPDAK
ncbi:MAG: 5-(carboxyamino)imidazole ribonucleotide mutase [Planctomycetota bacterium]